MNFPPDPLLLNSDQRLLDEFFPDELGDPFDPERIPRRRYIESDASRTLRQILDGYAHRGGKRTVSGRSILLSGQRGAGKTGTVLWALREIQAERVRAGEPVRLLYVPVVASTFLNSRPPENSVEDGSRPSVIWSREQQPDPPAERPPTRLELLRNRERLLVEICTSLHREVVREVHRGIQQHIAIHLNEKSGDRERQSELYTRAAQLDHDLATPVESSVLEDYWRDFGFYDEGIAGSALFPRIVPSNSSGAGCPSAAVPPGQAAAEIRLVQMLNEIHLRMTGKLSRVHSRTESVTPEEPAPVASTAPDRMGQILVALLGGGVASGAVSLTADHSNMGSSVLILLAGITGMLVASAMSTFSQSRHSTQTQRNFERDDSVATLDGRLREIITQLANAGLFPVFVIDELDKCGELLGDEEEQSWFQDLLDHLKDFCSAEAVFCFLTQRSFIEDLEGLDQQSPSGAHSTWFTDRLTIDHNPRDVRRFVENVQ